MAGGPFARTVTCWTCEAAGALAPAHRTHEGSKTDLYACAAGHTFRVHWREIPTSSTWGPDDQHLAVAAWHRWRARVERGEPGDATADWLEAERAWWRVRPDA